MKIRIDSSVYDHDIYFYEDQIKSISFCPENDTSGNTIPVESFTVVIQADDEYTGDEIGVVVSDFIYLYPENNGDPWCKYWVTKVEHDLYEHSIKVEAQSLLILLDRITMDPHMYVNGGSPKLVIDDIFRKVTLKYGIQHYVDSVYDYAYPYAVYGFFPEQTARERLQQVCMTIGANVSTMYASSAAIVITPRKTNINAIGRSNIYYRPDLSVDDIYTGIKVIAYTYTQGTPSTTDEYVTDYDDTTYIISKQEFTLTNPDLPARCLENLVEVDLKCVTTDNVGDLLQYMAGYYFKNERVSADINTLGLSFDVARSMGSMFSLSYGKSILTGWLARASYTFGRKSNRVKIEMAGATKVDGGELIIKCMNDTGFDTSIEVLQELRYTLPIGFDYSFNLPYIDVTPKKRRLICYPDEQYDPLTGEISSDDDDNTVEVPFHAALAWLVKKKRLYIIRVDTVTQNDEVVKFG